MTSTTETDIAKLASDALANATAPEKVREIVEREISKTVEDAIKQSVRSYSPFGRDLEKKLEEALKLNTLNLPSYGQMMTDMVQRLVQKHVADAVGARLEEDLREVLSIAPKTIKLSEIAEQMIKDSDDEYGDVITVLVEEDQDRRDGSTMGSWWTIYLDDEQAHDDPKKDAAIKLRVFHGFRDRPGADGHGANTGKIVSIEDGRRRISTDRGAGWHGTFRRPHKVYGLAERLLAYYAAGTVIEIDEENVVTSIGDH